MFHIFHLLQSDTVFGTIRESSFNMTGGGIRKLFDTRKGDSKKIVGLGRGAPKICVLQNQHGIIIQISLGYYYTLVHHKNALENFKN